MYVKIKDPRTIHSIMYSYHIDVRYIYSSSKKESINKDNKYWRQIVQNIYSLKYKEARI